MKKSNLILLILSVFMLAGIFITDRLLAVEYHKINLNDPYKNFEELTVAPFKNLKVTGGNGYAIRIEQADQFSIRLMKSRKSFFSMKMEKDSLSVSFTVANQNYQRPENVTTGLIISVPRLSYLQLSGTNTELKGLKQDSLTISQDNKAVTRLKELELDYLNLQGGGHSYYDFSKANQANELHLLLRNQALADLHEITFKQVVPVLADSAGMMMYQSSLQNLKTANLKVQDSILSQR